MAHLADYSVAMVIHPALAAEAADQRHLRPHGRN
jgi:hypothetical protein